MCILRCHALLALKPLFKGNLALCLWKGADGMITSVRRLIGMPVLFREKELGYVEQAYAGEGKLEGVVIRRGMGSARWLAAEEMMMALAFSTPAMRRMVRLDASPWMAGRPS